MRLTLLRAKEALKGKAPADKLEFRINRLCERLLTNGKYEGSVHRLAIAAPYGQVALPRRYRTILGVKVDGTVYEIGNQWYEFLPGKSDAAGYSMSAVRDLGDGWAIMYTPRVTPPAEPDVSIPTQDIPTGGTIIVDYPGVETLTVEIEGWDVTGAPVRLDFTGEQTLANPFARISRIHKEVGTVPVRVTFETDDNIQTVLALMEPTEEETYYRRYIIDTLQCETVAVAALCKRRHVEFTSDRDVLPFANISALELGMTALQFEAENDTTTAEKYWNAAVKVLNDELKDANAGSTFPLIRMVYPGRTTPRLTSHY